jgi:hypothetical protein
MKKVILAAGTSLIIFSLIVVPWRTEKTFTFAWQQRLPEPNDLAGWRLYQCQSPGGSPVLIETIPFKEKQIEYRVSRKLACPEKGESTRTFVLTAFDTSGNESSCSN